VLVAPDALAIFTIVQGVYRVNLVDNVVNV